MKSIMRSVKVQIIPLIVLALMSIFADLGTDVNIGNEINRAFVRFPFFYIIMSLFIGATQPYSGNFKSSSLAGLTRKKFVIAQLISTLISILFVSILYFFIRTDGNTLDSSTKLKVYIYYLSIFLMTNASMILISVLAYKFSAGKYTQYLVAGLIIVAMIGFRDAFVETLPMTITSFANNSMGIFLLIGIVSSVVMFGVSAVITMTLDVK